MPFFWVTGWTEGFRRPRQGRVVTGNSKAGSVARGDLQFYGDAAEGLEQGEGATMHSFRSTKPTSDSRALLLRPPRSARGGGRLAPASSAGTRPGFPAGPRAGPGAHCPASWRHAWIPDRELAAGRRMHARTLLELAAPGGRAVQAAQPRPSPPSQSMATRTGYLRRSVANAAETGFRW